MIAIVFAEYRGFQIQISVSSRQSGDLNIAAKVISHVPVFLATNRTPELQVPLKQSEDGQDRVIASAFAEARRYIDTHLARTLHRIA